MSMPQFSNVVDFELAHRFYSQSKKSARHSQPTFTEVSQLLSGRLQTTLDIKEVLGIFFQLSQHLIKHDALYYVHRDHKLAFRFGADNALYAVNYRLTFKGEYLGELFVQRSQKFTEQELIRFESLTASLVFPLRNSLSYYTAIQSALNDTLTGVGNRTSMDKTLQRDMETARRSRQPLSVIMLDIDYFKSINDSHGHNCGDMVLMEVANLLKRMLRSSDAIFRFGGEEFLMCMPNTCLENAWQVAERIRRAIEQLRPLYEHKQIAVSASLGCASMQPEDSQQDLIQRVDTALYLAKNSGRNQVRQA